MVLAAWESLVEEGYAPRAIWQSTTGTAPFLIVNGPVRGRIGLNSKGNVFGSGFPGERHDWPGHPPGCHQCLRTPPASA